MPIDPLAERRRKSPLDHREVGLADKPLAKLLRQIGGGRPGSGHHENTGHGSVEAAHHSQEAAGTGGLQDPKGARRVTGRVGRRQPGGLDDSKQVVILGEKFKWRKSLSHDSSVASTNRPGKRVAPPS